MERCKDHDKTWANTTDDVAPEQLEEYLKHAETCDYHAHQLMAEDEQLRSVFRIARGVDSESAFLFGADLERAIKNQKRQSAFWAKEVSKKEVPFTHLVLRNAGKEIACFGEFFQLQKHEGTHWLNVEAGLQILGVLDVEPSDEVLLGYYPLSNVRHAGEQFLRLNDDYVVALEVTELGFHTFQIQFRCVSDCKSVSIGEESTDPCQLLAGPEALPGNAAHGFSREGNSVVTRIWNLCAAAGDQIRRSSLGLMNSVNPFYEQSRRNQSDVDVSNRMSRDDRFYAFIISYTSRSRSQIRRVCLQKKWLKLSGVFAFLVLATSGYGFYGLTQQAAHLRIEHENQRLRAEIDKERQALQYLNNRVGAVEETSRRLAQASVTLLDEQNGSGQGGPSNPVNDIGTLEAMEKNIQNFEVSVFARQGIQRISEDTPNVWPVKGTLDSGFGGRKNPFGGAPYEFHSGQDIDAPHGTPITITASGIVVFVGWQHGYGRLVVIDHGAGISSRYGHLSEIDVALGQNVRKDDCIGLVGSTGRSTGPHLHYEIRIDNTPVNPLHFLLSDRSN